MNEGPNPAEAPTRELAERGIAEARKAYERSLEAGEAVFNRWEDMSAQVFGDAREIAHKLLMSSDVNMRAVFDLAEKMVRARSLQETQELQRAFFQEQTNRLMAQMKDLEKLTSRQFKSYGEKITRGRDV